MSTSCGTVPAPEPQTFTDERFADVMSNLSIIEEKTDVILAEVSRKVGALVGDHPSPPPQEAVIADSWLCRVVNRQSKLIENQDEILVALNRL